MRKLSPYCWKVLCLDLEAPIFVFIIASHNILVNAHYQFLQLLVELNNIAILLAGLLILCLKFVDILMILILQSLLGYYFLQILQVLEIHLAAWLLPQLNCLKYVISSHQINDKLDLLKEKLASFALKLRLRVESIELFNDSENVLYLICFERVVTRWLRMVLDVFHYLIQRKTA